MGLFKTTKEDDLVEDISSFDIEAWEQFSENFKALNSDEKLALNTLLTPEVKQQMFRGETILLQELCDKCTVKAEMESMNPFSF